MIDTIFTDNEREELMCYSYALGYNAGYNIGCYDDILGNIGDDYLDYFNKGYQRGIFDYCEEQV